MPSYTFSCHWLNQLTQLGYTSFDLDIECLDGPIPKTRISKTFQTEDVTEEQLEEEAMLVCNSIVEIWNLQNQKPVVLGEGL